MPVGHFGKVSASPFSRHTPRPESMSALHDLIARKNELDKRIAATQAAERTQALERIHALMAQHGLTVADLVLAKIGRTPRMLDAKYENRATGETWSGHGKRPRWLKQALEEGHRLEEFVVRY